MSNDAISDTVIDHALKEPANLEVACLIYANFEEVKTRVILRFLRLLQEQLRKSLGNEWKFENGLADDIKHGEFRVSKDGWAGQCAVVLSQDGEKRGFYVGWHKYKPTSYFTAALESKNSRFTLRWQSRLSMALTGAFFGSSMRNIRGGMRVPHRA